MQSLVEKYSYVTESDYQSVAGSDWPDYNIFVKHEAVPGFVYREIDEMLYKKQPFDHPSFCVNAFYAKELPSQDYCCLITDNNNIEDIRKKMINSERPIECQACWKLEDAGFDSDRLIKNRTLDLWSGKDLEDLYHEASNGNFSEIMYKIDTSNTCNSTCITCGSYASTQWAKLEKQNNIIPSSQWDLSLEDIDIDYKNVQTIIFRGGEPLLSRTNFHVLEKLIENNNTNCLISFTTNGSVRLTQRQLNILKCFPNIVMCFSIDGIKKVFEYMRYPLKWQDCVDNLQQSQDYGWLTSVSYTVSNLNIAYYTETVNWFTKHNLNYLFNAVYNPSYFRPGALPEHVKKQILHDSSSEELRKFLLHHTSVDDEDWKEAKLQIKKQDNWKNISINNYLPEVGIYFT